MAVESMEYWYGKRDLFLEMRDLALKEQESVIEDRMDNFRDLAVKRDGLQREITAREKRMKTLPKAPLNPLKGPRVHDLAEEISRIIASIQDIDRQIEDFIAGKKEALLMEIKSLRGGKRALKGYGGKGKRDPRFIDTQG